MNIFTTVYLTIGILIALYVVLSHFNSTWKYIKQLYTAKYVRPSDIKTFFGFKYWSFNNNDFWVEVIVMSTVFAAAWTIGSVLFWPLSIIFFLNGSIEKARKRISDEE